MNGRITKTASAIALAAGLIFAAAAPVQAQLATSGTYSGHYGWSSSGTTFQWEEGHTVWIGSYGGAFFNDAGSGFLHNSSSLCWGYTDMLDGHINAHGHCVVTDKEGDKAFVIWDGIGHYPELSGAFEWAGGTGKYAGMSGDNTFSGEFIPGTDQGHVSWKGKWKL